MAARRTFISLVGIGLLSLSTLATSGCGLVGNAEPSGGGSSSVSGPRVSLLDEFMGGLWGTNLSPKESQRRGNEQHLRREELISQCMAEAGFQYFPDGPQETPQTPVNASEIYRPNDRDWVLEFGYAAIVSPWESILGSGPEAKPVPEDRNAKYVESLSEAERQAYWDTLFGAPMEIEADANLTRADRLAMMGCWGWAEGQVNPNDPSEIYASDQFAPLFEAIDYMYNNLYQSPEFVAVSAEWASCMADAGYPGLVNTGDAQQLFFDQLNQFWTDWDWEQGSPTLESTPRLAELHQIELQIALADLDCRETVHLQARQDAATTAAEQQFINAHRAELEALRAAAEQY